MTETIISLYDKAEAAQAAVQELVDNDINRQDISLATREHQEITDKDTPPQQAGDITERTETPGEGAKRGAGVGAGIGALIGLGALTVPGIGAALVGGPLAATLAGVAVGAAGGGMAGALVELGTTEEEARFYTEGIRQGGTLLTVSIPDEKTSQVVTILNKHDPVNINERMAEWRASGWTGRDVNPEPYSEEDVSRERARKQDYSY
jgi:uncharacterized membrane protein